MLVSVPFVININGEGNARTLHQQVCEGGDVYTHNILLWCVIRTYIRGGRDTHTMPQPFRPGAAHYCHSRIVCGGCYRANAIAPQSTHTHDEGRWKFWWDRDRAPSSDQTVVKECRECEEKGVRKLTLRHMVGFIVIDRFIGCRCRRRRHRSGDAESGAVSCHDSRPKR